MDNYSAQIGKMQENFYLAFKIAGDGSDFMDYNLPTPNIVTHGTGGVCYWQWYIDGFFATTKGKEFLCDVVARFHLSYPQVLQRIYYRLQAKNTSHTNTTIHRLKEFQGLKSIVTKPKKSSRNNDHNKDNTFYAIKGLAEWQINHYGMCNHDEMINWAMNEFREKEPSTVRAKCRSVFNWYMERDFTIPVDNRTTMTREEYMTTKHSAQLENVHQIRRNRTQQKIVGAVAQLRFAGKKINIANVQKITNISRPTINKYKDLFIVGDQGQLSFD